MVPHLPAKSTWAFLFSLAGDLVTPVLARQLRPLFLLALSSWAKCGFSELQIFSGKIKWDNIHKTELKLLVARKLLK